MQLALAATTFMAAVGATYFFCVRPMRQGRHCAMSPPTDSNVPASATNTGAIPETLKAARAELDALREAIAAGTNGTTVENVASSAPRHTSDTESPASGFLKGAA
jgi:hypothetical protein